MKKAFGFVFDFEKLKSAMMIALRPIVPTLKFFGDITYFDIDGSNLLLELTLYEGSFTRRNNKLNRGAQLFEINARVCFTNARIAL